MDSRFRLFGISLMILGGLVLIISSFTIFGGVQGRPDPKSYLDAERAQNVSDNSTVIPFSRMSEAQRTVFVQELANESITVVPENVYIDIWVENDYVVYQNKSYRVAVAQN